MVKVRELERIVIVFKSKEAIYIKDKERGKWCLFHRFFEKGNYGHWRDFRHRLWYYKTIGFYDVCRYACKFDIESMTPTTLHEECDPYIKDNGGIYEN